MIIPVQSAKHMLKYNANVVRKIFKSIMQHITTLKINAQKLKQLTKNKRLMSFIQRKLKRAGKWRIHK